MFYLSWRCKIPTANSWRSTKNCRSCVGRSKRLKHAGGRSPARTFNAAGPPYFSAVPAQRTPKPEMLTIGPKACEDVSPPLSSDIEVIISGNLGKPGYRAAASCFAVNTIDRAIAEGKTASGIRFVWCLFDFVLCLSMTSDSDDESVRRLWEELLALRKVVKDAEADLPNPPCRIRPTTNGTARLRPRRGPRKPRSN